MLHGKAQEFAHPRRSRECPAGGNFFKVLPNVLVRYCPCRWMVVLRRLNLGFGLVHGTCGTATNTFLDSVYLNGDSRGLTGHLERRPLPGLAAHCYCLGFPPPLLRPQPCHAMP